MDVTDGQTVRTRFLDTYARPDGPHPYREHERYDLVLDHRDRHPRMGSAAIAKRIGLPADRVGEWLDGSPPESFAAVETLAEAGWLDLDWDGKQFRGLNVLVAWLVSSGSIDGSYAPRFDVEPETVGACTNGLEHAGATAYEVRRDDSGQAAAVRVEENAAVLGRLLSALGAPALGHTADRYGLPPYLAVAPDAVRKWFGEIYLLNKGSPRPGRREPIAISEDRSRAYLESVVALYRSLCDGRVRLGGERTIVFDDTALSSFDLASKRYDTAN